jgi:hypothetical protein
VLYVFVVLLHRRRQVVHFNVTDSPTAAWTAQQLVEAFPDDSAPRFLLRDRDSIYGGEFRRHVKGMLIAEVLTAPRSPWLPPAARSTCAQVHAGGARHRMSSAYLDCSHMALPIGHFRGFNCRHRVLANDSPAPGRRTRSVASTPCSNSPRPFRIVSRARPVAAETSASPPKPIARDSAAAHSRRVRSLSIGSMATYFITIVASNSVFRFTSTFDHTPIDLTS